MATLVLTVVGTVIGGPIGGSIGALIGQQADNLLFNKQPTVKGPRLKDLDIQSSSYGRPVPAIFGRMRISGSVIWSTRIVERKKKKGGGKNKPKTITYSYNVSFAVALSSRRALRIDRIWADGKLIYEPGSTRLSTGGKVRFYSGDGDQSVDPQIAGDKGVEQTPAYRGLSYCVFQGMQIGAFGNRIPSLTFELVADEAAIRSADIVKYFAENEIAVAEGQALVGYACDNGDMAQIVDDMALIDGLLLRQDGNGLALIRADPANLLTLTDDPVISIDGKSGEPTIYEREDVISGTRPVMLRYYDVGRDYQIGLQSSHVISGNEDSLRLELPLSLSASDAQLLARQIADRQADGAARLTISIDDANTIMAIPGDLLEIAGRPGRWLVDESEYRPGMVRLACRLWEAPHDVTATGAGSDFLGSDLPDQGLTRFYAMDLSAIPFFTDAVATLSLIAAGTGVDWPGAAISIEQDGVQYPLGEIEAGAIAGDLADPLAPSSPLLWDKANRPVVNLLHSDMLLEGADDAALALGANLVHIGEETLQFEQAVQIGDAQWRLEGLRRGLFGSEAAAAQGHQQGSTFVLVEGDMPRIAYDISTLESGLTLEFAAESLEDDLPVPVQATVDKRGLIPFAPAHFRWRRDGNDMRFDWVRRPRRYVAWQDAVDMPIAESREFYRIYAANSAEPLIEIVENSAALPLATLSALLGAGEDGLHLQLRQIGDFALSPVASLHLPAAAFA